MEKILPSSMLLGDVIRMTFQDGTSMKYSDCTVVKITDTQVILKRPYIYFDKSVNIPFIGVEDFEIWKISSVEYTLISR